MQIQINKNILLEYREGVFLGLTLRQTVCCALGLGITAGGYIVLQSSAGGQGASWAAMLAGALPFFFAFFKKDGLSFEKYIAAVFRCKYLDCKQRRYVGENALKSMTGREREIAENTENR